MPPPDPADAAAAVAAALLGGPIEAIAPVRGAGRNSRIYRISQGGQNYALKHYPEPEKDGGRRLGVELGALGLMTDHGIACVPRVMAADRERGYALLEWIEGEVVTDPTRADIDAACAFLAAVHALRLVDEAQRQPPAAEACLCASEIARQIERRMARLAAIAGEPELAAFLSKRVSALAAAIAAWAEDEYRIRGLSFATPVPPAARSLCPSDFGFHNALRTPRGPLVFLDFDYFGWDDPVKLCCDFLLHPGMQLSVAAKRGFAATVGRIYGDDPGFRLRLPLLFPLFALRWCLILLNEFLPERWENRRHAGVEVEWAAAKRHQLDRAADWVQSLAANFQRFPYGE
jgi:aminoglycoside phosphotransferase (APT) family kinase protein